MSSLQYLMIVKPFVLFIWLTVRDICINAILIDSLTKLFLEQNFLQIFHPDLVVQMILSATLSISIMNRPHKQFKNRLFSYPRILN